MKYTGINSKSVAILPFKNLSSNIENEYFCDGLTEEIINALSKIKDLSVTSRTSCFYFKNKKVTVKEVKTKLGVSYFIEGSVRLSKTSMRITVQMIDTENDILFWSETFDRDLEDIFKIQDEVSLLIAERLREHIGHIEIEDKLVEPFNLSVKTYREYLRGRYYLMKFDYESTLKSIEIFEDIIKEEPSFPNPYLDINQGYAYLGTMGLLPADEAFQKAQPYLNKALELDLSSSRSQLNLSWIECWQNWNLQKAYKHANNALERQPTDEVYLTISSYLTVQGKLDSALNYINKALELDPFSAINHHYKGYIYYLQCDYKKAIQFLGKSLSYNPVLPFPPMYIGQSLLLSGKFNEALEYFNGLEGVSLKDLTKLGGKTMSYAFLGDIQKCYKGISKLETYLNSELEGKALTFLVLTNVLLGNYKEAIDYVELAYRNKLPIILLFNTEPILKPIKSYKRFKKIMLQSISDNSNYTSIKSYRNSLLAPEDIVKYVREMEQVMIEGKLYLNPNLSLKDLAFHIELPANYVSQLLNQGVRKNFSEYVNTFRLNEFKERIILDENKNVTIMSIAYDSGFNSKTVFNTFFKKIEGITPNTYLKIRKKN